LKAHYLKDESSKDESKGKEMGLERGRGLEGTLERR